MFALLFSFKGRTGRSGYWLGSLVLMVASVVLGGIIGAITGFATAASGVTAASAVEVPGMAGMIGGLVTGLVTLYPSLAMTVKRLHDLGHSGWMVLGVIVALPVVMYFSIIVGILLMVGWWTYVGLFPGTKGSNDYGNPPSGLTDHTVSEFNKTTAQLAAREGARDDDDGDASPAPRRRRRPAVEGGFGRRQPV